jgi:putative flippase GtrA
LLLANIENTNFEQKSMLIKNSYFKSPTLFDALKLLRIQRNRIGEIFRFIINGGLIGLFSWIVQYGIYKLLIIQKLVAEDAIVFSIYLAFIIILLVNFVLQKNFVFRKSGSLFKFIIVNLLAISVVAIFSRLIIKLLKQNEIEAFIILAYPIAALTLAPMVYLIKSKFVFNKGL